MTPATPDAGQLAAMGDAGIRGATAGTAAHRFLAAVLDAADREWPERCGERGPSLVALVGVRGRPGWYRVRLAVEVYVPGEVGQ